MPADDAVHLTRVEPIYRPRDEADWILLYAGDLAVNASEATSVVTGQLELRLFPRAGFTAHFAGRPSALAPLIFTSQERSVSVPDGSALTPPLQDSVPERPDDGGWAEERIVLSQLDAGHLAAAERFVVHVGPSMQEPRFRVREQLSDGSWQGQVRFELGGWTLVLAPVDDARGDHDFGAVVEATPSVLPVSAADVEQLAHRLFVLLSLVSSREVGIGPIAGLDNRRAVVWAKWGSPRLRIGKSGAGWCPGHLLPTTLPALAKGYAGLTTDAAMEVVAERAVEHLLSADSSEVLDVRIPVACSGLELLAWAVLRRQGWVDQDTFRRLTAGAAVRLLINWTGLNADVPDGFDALAARRGRLGQSRWDAPELLFDVRNGIIHPPRALDDPEWPSGDELIEAWQLSTWYLQLVILRLLDYRGQYWSRLRLGRSEMDVETVPWTMPAGDSAAGP